MIARCASIVLLLASLALAADAPALRPPDRDGRQKRRTPVVAVVEACKDSVVNFISPRAEGKHWRLREFFDVIPDEPGKPEVSELGSGFIVHADGYIVTNAHVVDRSIRHTVVLADGTQLAAQVIGVEPKFDLALVKVDPPMHPGSLKPVTLAIAGDVVVGETVVSIGNPHGLKHTATAGIVSALGRETITEPQKAHLFDLIQTDAPINPGNSGGPLFNALGEVIGVVVSEHKGQNLAFAIPVATVRQRLAAMMRSQWRYAVVTGLTLGDDGRTITAVEPNSPAATAGLSVGDSLERLGDRRIDGAGDFDLALVGHKVSDELVVAAKRGGVEVRGSLTLADRHQPSGAERLWSLIGVKVRTMTADEAKAMGLRFADGLMVTEVRPEQYAGQDAPEPGDVLARIGLDRPRTLHEAGRLMENTTPGTVYPIVFVRLRDGQATRVDVSMKINEPSPPEVAPPAPAPPPPAKSPAN